MRRLIPILAALILATVSYGQSVTKVELARDNGKGHAGAIVKSFSPKDSPIHIILHLKPLSAPYVFSGSLIAVSVANVKKNYSVASANLSASARMDFVDFKFSLPHPWPSGSYKVVVKVEGKWLKDISFDIK